jgi:hypothetical protein
MGLAARTLYVKEFAWDVIARRYLALLEEET